MPEKQATFSSPSSPSSSPTLSLSRLPQLPFVSPFPMFFLLLLLYFISTPMMLGVHAVDTWCNPVLLDYDDTSNDTMVQPFITLPPSWWQNYFYINNTLNTTEVRKFVVKVYPGRPYPFAMMILAAYDVCPQPQGAAFTYDRIDYGINKVLSITLDIQQPTMLMLYVHTIGVNYTLVGGIPGTLPELCSGDCNSNGYCDVYSHKCTCHGGYEGEGCERKIIPPHIPFGSWGRYYAVIVGAPVGGAALLAAITTFVVLIRKRRRTTRAADVLYTKVPDHDTLIVSDDTHLHDVTTSPFIQAQSRCERG